MDCDNQEIEATKTIGSTDIDKVLKNLKNKHTKDTEMTQEEIFALYKAKAQVNINMKNQIKE